MINTLTNRRKLVRVSNTPGRTRRRSIFLTWTLNMDRTIEARFGLRISLDMDSRKSPKPSTQGSGKRWITGYLTKRRTAQGGGHDRGRRDWSNRWRHQTHLAYLADASGPQRKLFIVATKLDHV